MVTQEISTVLVSLEKSSWAQFQRKILKCLVWHSSETCISSKEFVFSHMFTECFYSLKEDSLLAALEWLRDQGLASCCYAYRHRKLNHFECQMVLPEKIGPLIWRCCILITRYILCDVIQMLIFHLGEIQNHLPRPVHNDCKWPLGISVRSESDCTRVIWTLRLLLMGKLHLFIVVTDTFFFSFFPTDQGLSE